MQGEHTQVLLLRLVETHVCTVPGRGHSTIMSFKKIIGRFGAIYHIYLYLLAYWWYTWGDLLYSSTKQAQELKGMPLAIYQDHSVRVLECPWTLTPLRRYE